MLWGAIEHTYTLAQMCAFMCIYTCILVPFFFLLDWENEESAIYETYMYPLNLRSPGVPEAPPEDYTHKH